MKIHTLRVTLCISPKLHQRVKRRAGQMGMASSTFMRYCLEQTIGSMEWDDQIAKDVKTGKIKGLYPREGV